MSGWYDYRTHFGHAPKAPGKLLVFPGFYSPQLRNHRHLLAWLPPGYTASRRYPVFYVQDGQNLFDPATSFGQHWGLAESMAFLAERGRPAIVIGVPNLGRRRIAEYSPFVDRSFGGGLGDEYLRFLADTVKPCVDQSFSTRPEPAATGLAGSSLGGSLAIYGVIRRADVFGLCAALSPSCWFARGALNRHLNDYRRLGGDASKIYMDVGLCERGRMRRRPSTGKKGHTKGSVRYTSAVDRVYNKLRRKGLADGQNLLYVIDPTGEHNEFHWRRRWPLAAAFLLKGL